MKKRTQESSFRKNGTVRFVIFLYVIGSLKLLAAPQLPRFEDVTAKARINFRNEPNHTSRKYLPETMGGGVAMFDYDKDGLLDIFFVNGAALRDPMPPGKAPDKSDPKYWNRLYRNNGDGTFSDVTERAGVKGSGYGMGVAVADYDNDGYPDLYVTNVGQNILYHNNGDGTFTDVTEHAGVQGAGWSAGAMFIDYDRDGLLDLFVSRYLTWDFSQDIFCGQTKPGFRAYCHPDQFKPITHILFHNEGHGRFRDASKQSGIANFPGKGLGIAMNDYDRDGWPDIVVANDSFPEQLFHNLKNGKFEEVGVSAGIGYDEDGHTFAGMGVDFADYDNDGWPDIFINALALQKYALFHNRAGNFDYVSGPLGIAGATVNHSGWGAKFVDYDNDGSKDLFIGQGHVMDNIELTQPETRYLEPPMLLRNESGRFINVSRESGPVFRRALAARGAAFADFNNNGFVDVALNCNGEPAMLLKNTGNANHWLVVDTIGTKSNRDGIGAELHLTTEDGKQQYAVVSTGSSYLSANDKRAYFGIGRSATIKALEIKWPSGIVQRFTDLKPDRIFIAREEGQAP
jgi:enediyne biosynthesis protein E4